MVRSLRLACCAALIGGVVLIGVVQAADKHHHAKELLGNKLNTDGKHELHKVGEHTVHAHVKNKKIKEVTVTHSSKGAVDVKKYKTSKKVVLANPGEATHFGLAEADSCDTILYVGYAFTDGIHWYFYWFPVDEVEGGDANCIDYP
jgi:hypothetical protein